VRGFLLSFSSVFRYIQSSGNFRTILTSSVISQRSLQISIDPLLGLFFIKTPDFFFPLSHFFFRLRVYFFLGDHDCPAARMDTRAGGDLEKNTSPI